MFFGRNFKKYRKKKGISQKEFAHMLFEVTGKKLTLTSVSNYETGIHMPPTQMLPAIADILEVSIDALFGKEKQAEAQEEIYTKGTTAEEEAPTLKEWRQELAQLEQDFIYWKARHANATEVPVQGITEQCQKMLGLAKAQQEELVVLQTELNTIRELMSFFKK
jgi:transcriptional regulator with XRE-family HTH domain